MVNNEAVILLLCQVTRRENMTFDTDKHTYVKVVYIFFPGKLFSDRILTINFELNISNYRSVEKFYSHKAFIIIQ